MERESEENVAIRTADGLEYGFADLATAKRMHPDGEWIGYQDGTRFEETVPLKKPKKVAEPAEVAADKPAKDPKTG